MRHVPQTKEEAMPKWKETLDMNEHVLTPSSRKKYEDHLARMDRWLKGRELNRDGYHAIILFCDGS